MISVANHKTAAKHPDFSTN